MNHEEFESKAVSPHCHGSENKPLEIYMFVDPLCPECWSLEPIIKKLSVEYGRYFSLKHVISGKLTALNRGKRQNYEQLVEQWEKTGSRSGMSCDGSVWYENPVSSPQLASIAIKAAELQGRKAGIRFLRKLQEKLFLEKKNVSDFEVLKECANQIGLDVVEFVTDIHSESAAKAFQCDVKITAEMDVEEIPTLVFFNENIEDEGIKVTGQYAFDVYEQILKEMVPYTLEPSPLPDLELFIKHYKLVATSEVAVVYNMTEQEVNKEMKKLQLKQIVEQVPAKHGAFWKSLD